MQTIAGLQKKIVIALEKGEDPTPILGELADLRAKIAAEGELAELQKIADERQALRDRAEAVKGKVQRQGEAIDAFLKARDAITEELVPIVVKIRELPKLQSECYAEYHDAGRLAWKAKLPNGYLPSDLKVPMLAMRGDMTYSYDVAAQALFYLQAGLGLLVNLVKEERPYPEREAGEFEAIDPEATEVELNCRVCNHEKAAEINKALQDGRPLRELEVEFNVSRSTLSRHKNNCLNLGAIKISD